MAQHPQLTTWSTSTLLATTHSQHRKRHEEPYTLKEDWSWQWRAIVSSIWCVGVLPSNTSTSTSLKSDCADLTSLTTRTYSSVEKMNTSRFPCFKSMQAKFRKLRH